MIVLLGLADLLNLGMVMGQECGSERDSESMRSQMTYRRHEPESSSYLR